jgi:hypothetical protein
VLRSLDASTRRRVDAQALLSSDAERHRLRSRGSAVASTHTRPAVGRLPLASQPVHQRAEPVPVRDVVERLWDEADELVAGDQPGMIDDLHEFIAEGVWRAVEALADWGTMTIEEGECSITPLGAWPAVDFTRDDGYDAAVVGELAADAATVLEACGEIDVEDAAAGLAGWIEARQPDEAGPPVGGGRPGRCRRGPARDVLLRDQSGRRRRRRSCPLPTGRCSAATSSPSYAAR